MADSLKTAGYSTSCIGKWHLGALDKFYPTERGFDHFCGLREGSRSYWFEPEDSDQPGSHKAIEINGDQVEFDGYLTDFFTDQALQYIQSHLDSTPDKPFFVYLYYIRPGTGAGQPGETMNWSAKNDIEATRNLPWKAMSFVVGGERYTTVYIDHPDNPKPARYSERDCGRFGSYFVAEATPDKPVEVRYRLVIVRGEIEPAGAEVLSKAMKAGNG